MKILVEKRDGIADLRGIYSFFRMCKDGRYMITTQKIRGKRTVNQNEYLWGLVYPLLLDSLVNEGWEFTSTEQVHEFFKSLVAKREVVNYSTGEIVSIPVSTSEMDTVQFSSYLQEIRKYAKEYLNLEIPDPDKDWDKKSKT